LVRYSYNCRRQPIRAGCRVASSASFSSGELHGGADEGMDAQPNWRGAAAASRLSYKNATIAVCAFNLLVAALLLHNYFSSWTRIAGGDRLDSGMVR
jgi:hypothetical protein